MDVFQFGVTTGDATAGHSFTFRQPFITGKRAAIAQAAHEAGFDCSNPAKLLHLIDAVVMANNKFGYPDRWDGPAAFQSTVYPDTWTAAHAARRDSREHATPYDDDDAKPAAVPEFAASAANLIRNLSSLSWTNPKKARDASGAGCESLGERALNKRTAAVQLPENQSFKRPKLETPPPAASSQSVQIDLTRGENSRPGARHLAESNVSRPITTTRGHHPNRLNAQQRAARTHQAEAIAAGTSELLHATVARLKAGVLNVAADREALRARWEVDKRLQLLTITEHLKDLSDCFALTEEGLQGAVDVIERFIL
ncbi:MAG: hypothetical protein LQ344_002187 [Seirophora lacunosa]|nr:MAG: hypothetical protein LQ344_002187 [Seirophora lacunosa]